MEDRASVRARLGWPADPATLRRIRRLWQRHSIAEDRRDIDGLIATLAPECVYEIVGTGLRWDGHEGARAFYTELFAAFPDNRFALTDIVIGPQGVFEAVVLEATHLKPVRRPRCDRTQGAPGARDPVPLGSRRAAVRWRADLHRSGGAGRAGRGLRWRRRSRGCWGSSTQSSRRRSAACPCRPSRERSRMPAASG